MTVDLLDRTAQATSEEQVYVTLTVSGQLCGIPVLGVRDILAEQPITRIPLAPPDIAGSLNLRGRIVTAIDLRRRLNLPPPEPGQKRMSVVAEQGGELYALLVDQVSEVMSSRHQPVRTQSADSGAELGVVQHRHLPVGRTAAGDPRRRPPARLRDPGLSAT